MGEPLSAGAEPLDRRLIRACVPYDPAPVVDAELAAAAIEHGLGALLGARLAAGRLPLGEGFEGSAARRDLDESYRRCARVNAGLALSLELLLAALAERGVAAMVLKGDALLRAVYRDPGCRPMGDVDLLVRPEDWSTALAAAAAAGAHAVDAPGRRVTLRLFHEQHLLLPGGGMVDLHRRLVPRPLFAVDTGGLFDRGERQPDGAWLPAPADLFVGLALHAAKDGFLLPPRSLVDGLVLLASGTVEPAAVEQRARSWRARRAVARWLQLLAAHGELDEQWSALPERLAPGLGEPRQGFLEPAPADPSALGVRLRVRLRHARLADAAWRPLLYALSGALLFAADLVEGACGRLRGAAGRPRAEPADTDE